MTLLAALAAVVVGTWNGEWFPSGRAEHRAHPDVEAATIEAAGKMLRGGIDLLDPEGTNGVVLCLNEIRGGDVVERLRRAIGRDGLSAAVVTGYRRRDRFDQQQDVIMTTLPSVEASWSLWRNAKKDTPPRGFAYARLVFSPSVTAAVYAVHLKSNYGANTAERRAANMRKRAAAVDQLVALERPRRGFAQRPVVIAGDFNADPWRKEFAGEAIFAALDAAGFRNALALLPPDGRGTHPSEKWGASALDHLMLRGVGVVGVPVIVPSKSLSDHDAVFVLVE